MNEQQIQRSQTPPPNYLVFAILTTIFCCQILGIVSIVYAAQVNSKWAAGDYEGAREASKNAKLWAWISTGSGILIAIAMTLLGVFAMIAGFIFEGGNF